MKMFSINVLLSKTTLNLIKVLKFQSTLDDDFGDCSGAGDYRTGQCLDLYHPQHYGEDDDDDVNADCHIQ